VSKEEERKITGATANLKQQGPRTRGAPPRPAPMPPPLAKTQSSKQPRSKEQIDAGWKWL
jgi:hypothetical protein